MAHLWFLNHSALLTLDKPHPRPGLNFPIYIEKRLNI